MPLGYAFLSLAIAAEVLATSLLKASDGFTRPLPAAISLACYGLAFYCLALTLRTVPIGVAYGIWSGAGIILITTIGMVWYGERLDTPALIGLGLIVVGILVVNLLSRSVSR